MMLGIKTDLFTFMLTVHLNTNLGFFFLSFFLSFFCRWGDSWGEDGYFKMKRGTDDVATESMAVSARIEPPQ